MKSLLFLFLFLVSLGARAQVINDPNAVVRTVPPFHAIEISGGIDLYLSQGEQAVAISARDAATRDEIRTEVKDGILHISPRGWLGNRSLKAYVACPHLDQLAASGGCDVALANKFKTDSLAIRLSGGSDLSGEVEAGSLTIAQSGGSDADLKGQVGRLTIATSGGSDFKGFDLATDECTISASGGSDIKITVNHALWAEATGASDVLWKGTGQVRKANVSGVASISHRS